MRDWTRAFRRASFRGAAFWVDREELSGGRRVAVHEIAGGEVPVIEDLGQQASRHAITAYAAGDAADFEARALTAALVAPGAGMLVLPMAGGMLAHVEGFSRARRKDRNGFVAFDIGFVAGSASIGFAPAIGASGVDRLFVAGAAAAAMAIVGIFA